MAFAYWRRVRELRKRSSSLCGGGSGHLAGHSKGAIHHLLDTGEIFLLSLELFPGICQLFQVLADCHRRSFAFEQGIVEDIHVIWTSLQALLVASEPDFMDSAMLRNVGDLQPGLLHQHLNLDVVGGGFQLQVLQKVLERGATLRVKGSKNGHLQLSKVAVVGVDEKICFFELLRRVEAHASNEESRCYLTWRFRVLQGKNSVLEEQQKVE